MSFYNLHVGLLIILTSVLTIYYTTSNKYHHHHHHRLQLAVIKNASFALRNTTGIDYRIIGGELAKPKEFPFMASIIISGNGKTLGCGGSIIHHYWVLTAAHCIDKTAKITVHVGSNTFGHGASHAIASAHIHPHYANNLNDIALLQLATRIEFNNHTTKTAIDAKHIGNDVGCMLIGWGRRSTESNAIATKLHKVQLHTTACRRASIFDFLLGLQGKNEPQPKEQLCTSTEAHEGACQGDSGGPLIANQMQIGIVSGGEPCARGPPDIYTRVSHYIEWIGKHIHKI